MASSHEGEAFFVRQRAGAARLILVTGGARAGKSRFAQGLAEAKDCRRRLFVATAVPCDAEMKRRITRHRQTRNGLWTTLEEPHRLPESLPARFLQAGSIVLLDCLPTFTTNLLLRKASERQILSRVRRLISALKRPGVHSIWVTNEVGLGLVPDHPLGRRFRDLLGGINQEVASESDEVYLLVAGIPMKLKGR